MLYQRGYTRRGSCMDGSNAKDSGMKDLRQLSHASLKDVLEALEQQIPASPFRQADDINGENVALKLAFRAGEQAVLTRLRDAIRPPRPEGE